jgi:hypothetical protein
MPRVRLESRKCKIIAWFFTVAAVPILAWSIWSIPKVWPQSGSGMLLGLSLYCSAFCAPRIPYAVLFMGLLYPMMAGTVLGPAGAVVATALYAIPALFLVRPERMAGLMLFSVMICNAYLCSFAYRLVKEQSVILEILLLASVSFLMFYPLIQGGFKSRIPWALNPLLCAAGATFAGHGHKVILFLALALAPIEGVIYAWSRHLALRWFKKLLKELEEKKGDAETALETVKP